MGLKIYPIRGTKNIQSVGLMLAAAATLFVVMLVLDATLYSLMLIAEQIVHGLHRVEGAQRNLYEYGVPVAHRTIPETWQLQGLEILTVLTLA